MEPRGRRPRRRRLPERLDAGQRRAGDRRRPGVPGPACDLQPELDPDMDDGPGPGLERPDAAAPEDGHVRRQVGAQLWRARRVLSAQQRRPLASRTDRKSVGWGKRGSVRVYLGDRRILKKKKKK